MGLEGTKRLENQIRHKHQVNQLIYIFCDTGSWFQIVILLPIQPRLESFYTVELPQLHPPLRQLCD